MWLAWSGATLLAASLAMTLPVSNSSPWTAAMHAPPLARWDAVWYRSVAVDGYSNDPSSLENNVGFYPLYPLALRAISRVLPFNILWIGIGFSLACLLAALLLAGRIFFDWGGEVGAIRGTAALLLYPTSFYFASVYTESLFLLLAVAAFWASRRNRWAVAGAAGFLASLTRLNGFLLAIPIAWYGWRSWRERRMAGGRRIAGERRMAAEPRGAGMGVSAWAPAALAAAATLAGAAVFPAFLAARFGDPLLYVHSKAAGWGMRSGSILALVARIGAGLRDAFRDPAGLETLSFASQLASAVLFVYLTVRLFRRGLPAEGLYAAASLVLLFHASTLAGMDRYVLALFPAFFALAADLGRRPALAFACMLFGVTLQVTFLHRFVHWIMVS